MHDVSSTIKRVIFDFDNKEKLIKKLKYISIFKIKSNEENSKIYGKNLLYPNKKKKKNLS